MTLELSSKVLTRVLSPLFRTEKEAYRQLDDKEVYEQVPGDPSVPASTLIKALEKYVCGGICGRTFLTNF